MAGAASVRRDTPAARAALARRRQRAAQALKPQPQQEPKKETTSVHPKPPSLRIHNTNKNNTNDNGKCNDVKFSPQRNVATKQHSSPSNETSDGTLTTAAMTTESSSFFMERSPAQKIIHYTTTPKTTTTMTESSTPLPQTTQRVPSSNKQIPRVPVPPSRSKSTSNMNQTAPNTINKTAATARSSSTPRSSATLSARLSRARFRSQSPSTRMRVPPSIPNRSTAATPVTATPAATTTSQDTISATSNTTAEKPKSSRLMTRTSTKPPAVSTNHVANKTTATAHTLASSPTRAALRSRIQPVQTPNNSNKIKPATNSTNDKSQPNASKSPIRQVPQRSRSQQKPQRQQQHSPLRSKSPPPSPRNYPPSPSQRISQQPHKQNNAPMSKSPMRNQRNNTPLRITSFLQDTSFSDISTILDQTLPPLDQTLPPVDETPIHNKSTILDRTLPPLDAATPPPPADSGLLEEYYQHSMEPSSERRDASSLQHQSTVMLRSCSCNTAIQAIDKEENDIALAADPSGLCLGRIQEVLAIDKVSAETSSELRHGDIIQLGFQKSYFLGVQKTRDVPAIAFYDKDVHGGKEDNCWKVLVVKPGKKVLVGRAAVAAANKNGQSNGGKKGKIIGSGDPILLRHVPTGGVLSVQSNNLKLVTDSYTSAQSRAQDPSLIDRLQHHDHLLPSKDEVFQFLLSSNPPCPPWLALGNTSSATDERIFLTGSYLLQPKRHHAELEAQLSREETTQLSSSIKEKILIEEVIGSFLGLEGRHIKVQPSAPNHNNSDASLDLKSASFQLCGADGVDFDRSLRNLVEQILPMSTSYIRVQNFISSHHPGYEYGRMMQAFCEGVDALMQDYVTFVVQMERQHRKYKQTDSTLTMKSIYFQITPSLHSMSILEHATRAVRTEKGGALINALWSLEKLVYMGDMVAKKVLGILLEKSSVPYLDMLSAWLESGRLIDPYGEFMVQRSTKDIQPREFDGDAWMELFTINEQHIVEGITSDKRTRERILTTGKYWNAVLACHVDVETSRLCGVKKIPKLPFNTDSSAISSYIDTMYQNASQVLVKLMKDDFKLKDSLLVMKRYFLLDQGDFVTNFLDRAEEELRKPSEDLSVSRIQSWLNLSIQLTEGRRDDARGGDSQCPLTPHALRCRFSGKSLVTYLDSLYGGIVDSIPPTPSRQAYGMSKQGNSGIELFAIDFLRMPFPVSLILSHHTMDKYKLLFRHLIFTKHVERRLIGVWRDHQFLKKLDSLRGLLGPTFLVRQRMLHFVQNLLYYMSFEVIDNNWDEMMTAIDTSKDSRNQEQQTVDDILTVHNHFLQTTLEACLLTNQELVRSLTKLLNTCLLFTEQMKRFMDTTKIYDDSTILATEKRVAVQRNLNERDFGKSTGKKKTIRGALMSTRQEREALIRRQTRRVGREVISDSYQNMVKRFDEVFTADLFDVMMQLNAHTSSGLVANLGVRLDYNGFVTATIRAFEMERDLSRHS